MMAAVLGNGASTAYAYLGTICPLVLRTTIYRGASPYANAEAVVDAGRPPGMGMRSAAVWATASVEEATAIAAIRAHNLSPQPPHSAIRVYRVGLAPFHLAPVAILDELQERVTKGGEVQLLIQEYWSPTGNWHLRELVAPFLTVAEEVAPASEAETYIPRWVRFNADRKRARSL